MQSSFNVFQVKKLKLCAFKSDFDGDTGEEDVCPQKKINFLWSFPSTCGSNSLGVLWGVCVFDCHPKMDDLRRGSFCFRVVHSNRR